MVEVKAGWSVCAWLACLWFAGGGLGCPERAEACGGEGAGPAVAVTAEAPAPVEAAPALPGPRPGCPRDAAVYAEMTLGADGVLAAAYTHGGGCGQHDYCVGYDDSKAPAHVEVWFSHIHDGTDRCKALLMPELTVQLPPSVLSAVEVVQVTEGGHTRPLKRAAQAPSGADCPEDKAVKPDNQTLRPDGVFEATYQHGGGCGKHAYCVGHRYDAATDSAVVWFSHLHDGTDMCEALLMGKAEAQLPAQVLGAKRLTLKTSATDALPLR